LPFSSMPCSIISAINPAPMISGSAHDRKVDRPQSLSTEDYPVIGWLLRGRLVAFEKAYDYDLSYVREILEVSPRAALRLGRVAKFGSYCEGVPRDAIFAARHVGTMAEDCGPCTQLVATMAEREGVAPSTIEAILAGDERA